MMNKKQKSELKYSQPNAKGKERNSPWIATRASSSTATKEQLPSDMSKLMEIVVENKLRTCFTVYGVTTYSIN
jgi:hypothetical protein